MKHLKQNYINKEQSSIHLRKSYVREGQTESVFDRQPSVSAKIRRCDVTRKKNSVFKVKVMNHTVGLKITDVKKYPPPKKNQKKINKQNKQTKQNKTQCTIRFLLINFIRSDL